MKYPVGLVVCALLAGVALQHWHSASVQWCAATVAACWVSALASLVLRRVTFVVAFVAIGFASAGAALAGDRRADIEHPALRAWFDRHANPTTDRLDLAWLVGRLRNDAAPTEFGAHFDVDLTSALADGSSTAVRGGVRASVSGQFTGPALERWRAGRVVRFPASLRRPARFLNPGVADHELAFSRRDIVLLASIKSAALVEVLERGGAWQETAGAIRAYVRGAVRQSVGRWSARSAAVVMAIVIGDRAGLTADEERRLQDAGTYHVIAISGGNLAILAALLFGCLRLTALGPRSVAWTTLLFLAVYGGLVEGGASVTRAVLMAIAALAAIGLDHRTAAMNAVSLAAGIAVVVEPAVVYDAGLYLSFGATIALVAGVPRIAALWPIGRSSSLPNAPEPSRTRNLTHLSQVSGCSSDRRGPSRGAGPLDDPSVPGVRPRMRIAARWTTHAAAMLVGATVCVEVVLFPVSTYLFSRFSIAGLVLNLAAVPMMTIVQIAGMAAALTTMASVPLSAGVGYVAHVGATGLVESSGLVLLAPALAQHVPPPSTWVVVLYLTALGSLLICRRRLKRWLLAGLTITLGGVIYSGLSSPVHSWFHDAARRERSASKADPTGNPNPRVLRVVFFDVGQGDATLIHFPNGTRWLIDAGGSTSAAFDIGERVLTPSLWATGARRTDLLVLSHGDPDHIGGAMAILSEFRPGSVWEGIAVAEHRGLRELREAATQAGVRWRNVTAPLSESVGDVDVRLHHPPPPDWERPRVRNDDSLVLELRYGAARLVLPGDVGRDTERGLTRTMDEGGLVVLKVPHHGSASSSTMDWIERLSPAIAVVSAGRANRYGHPAPAVLDRYAAIKARVFRTDRDGAILVETDGRTVVVKTMTGRELKLRGSGL